MILKHTPIKKGKKLYKFRIYVGFVDDKSKYVNRAGFKTKTEAKKVYQEVKLLHIKVSIDKKVI
ncbi:Arm DNA-binding domain-containing protein [Ligilactobacillus salivarius]|uniref:Arm DNA-binding domain-containing protein n=1 Tax=Ligilactobacillus salivarius TaxID=1624 RepID=UPI0025A39BB5|nr:Arm DNA-binding domain-containing protein [Ligilactobacillus salivarius]MDM8224023.1 Arm DNA-binding domain-containing protein [Ligilactobacillus salivarius]